MLRFIAFLILVLPGILAVYGIKLIRDSFFGFVNPIFFNAIVQLLMGFIFVAIGIGFIGGYLLHRDKKRNKTKGRFENKK